MVSQTYTSNSGLINFNLGNKYEEAEITYSDNTKVKGYINGFIENNSIEVGLGLDPARLYVTVFEGTQEKPYKDLESIEIWKYRQV